MANYFVASTGNDSNTGTTAGSPKLTLAAAIALIAGPGDILNGDGTFASQDLAGLPNGTDATTNVFTVQKRSGASTFTITNGGIQLSGRSYIKFIGVTVNNVGHSAQNALAMTNSHHIETDSTCVFTDGGAGNGIVLISTYAGSCHDITIDGTISSPNGDVLDVGDSYCVYLTSQNISADAIMINASMSGGAGNTYNYVTFEVAGVSLPIVTHVGSASHAANSGTRSVSSVVVGATQSLMIAAVHYDSNVTGEVSGVVFNTSETMTSLIDKSGINYAGIHVWYLKNPSVTTASVVATMGANQATLATAVGVTVLQYADLSSTFRDTDSANGTGIATGNLTLTTEPGDMVLNWASSHGYTTLGGTAGGSQTERYDRTFGTGPEEAMHSTVAAGGVTKSVSYAWTDNTPFVQVAIAVAGVQPAQVLMLLA